MLENSNLDTSLDIVLGINGSPARYSETDEIYRHDLENKKEYVDTSVFYMPCNMQQIVERFLPVARTLYNDVSNGNYIVPNDIGSRCVTFGEIKDSAESMSVVISKGPVDVSLNNFNIYDYYDSDSYDKNSYVTVNIYHKGDLRRDKDGNSLGVVTEDKIIDGFIYHNSKTIKFNGKPGHFLPLKVRKPETDSEGEVVYDDLYLDKAPNNKLTRLEDIEADFNIYNIQIELRGIKVEKEDLSSDPPKTNENLFVFSRNPSYLIDDLRNPKITLYNYTTYSPYTYKYKLVEGTYFNFRLASTNANTGRVYLSPEELQKYESFSYNVNNSANWLPFEIDKSVLIDNIESDVRIVIQGKQKERCVVYVNVVNMLTDGYVKVVDIEPTSGIQHTIISEGKRSTLYYSSWANPLQCNFQITYDNNTPKVYKKAEIYWSRTKIGDTATQYMTPAGAYVSSKQRYAESISKDSGGYYPSFLHSNWQINLDTSYVYQMEIVLTEAFKPFPINLMIYPAAKFNINGISYSYINPVDGTPGITNVVVWKNDDWYYSGMPSIVERPDKKVEIDDNLLYSNLLPNRDMSGNVYYKGKVEVKEEYEDYIEFYFSSAIVTNCDNIPKNMVPLYWYWYMQKNRVVKDDPEHKQYPLSSTNVKVKCSNIDKGSTLYIAYKYAVLPSVTFKIDPDYTDIQLTVDGNLVKDFNDMDGTYTVLCSFNKALNTDYSEYKMDITVKVDGSLEANKLHMTLVNKSNPSFGAQSSVTNIDTNTSTVTVTYSIPRIRLGEISEDSADHTERPTDEFEMTLSTESVYIEKDLYIKASSATFSNVLLGDREGVKGYLMSMGETYYRVFETPLVTPTAYAGIRTWQFLMKKGRIIPITITLNNEKIYADNQLYASEYYTKMSIKFYAGNELGTISLNDDSEPILGLSAVRGPVAGLPSLAGDEVVIPKTNLIGEKDVDLVAGQNVYNIEFSFAGSETAYKAKELFGEISFEELTQPTYTVTTNCNGGMDKLMAVYVYPNFTTELTVTIVYSNTFTSKKFNVHLYVQTKNQYILPYFDFTTKGPDGTETLEQPYFDNKKYVFKKEDLFKSGYVFDCRYNENNIRHRHLFVRVNGSDFYTVSGSVGTEDGSYKVNIGNPSATKPDYYYVDGERIPDGFYYFKFNCVDTKETSYVIYGSKNQISSPETAATTEWVKLKDGDTFTKEEFDFVHSWGYYKGSPIAELDTTNNLNEPLYQTIMIDIVPVENIKSSSVEFVDGDQIEFLMLINQEFTFDVKYSEGGNFVEVPDANIYKNTSSSKKTEIWNPDGSDSTVERNLYPYDFWSRFLSYEGKSFDSTTGVTTLKFKCINDYGLIGQDLSKTGKYFGNGDIAKGLFGIKYTNAAGEEETQLIDMVIYSGKVVFTCTSSNVFNIKPPSDFIVYLDMYVYTWKGVRNNLYRKFQPQLPEVTGVENHLNTGGLTFIVAEEIKIEYTTGDHFYKVTVPKHLSNLDNITADTRIGFGLSYRSEYKTQDVYLTFYETRYWNIRLGSLTYDSTRNMSGVRVMNYMVADEDRSDGLTQTFPIKYDNGNNFGISIGFNKQTTRSVTTLLKDYDWLKLGAMNNDDFYRKVYYNKDSAITQLSVDAIFYEINSTANWNVYFYWFEPSTGKYNRLVFGYSILGATMATGIDSYKVDNRASATRVSWADLTDAKMYLR